MGVISSEWVWLRYFLWLLVTSASLIDSGVMLAAFAVNFNKISILILSGFQNGLCGIHRSKESLSAAFLMEAVAIGRVTQDTIRRLSLRCGPWTTTSCPKSWVGIILLCCSLSLFHVIFCNYVSWLMNKTMMLSGAQIFSLNIRILS